MEPAGIEGMLGAIAAHLQPLVKLFFAWPASSTSFATVLFAGLLAWLNYRFRHAAAVRRMGWRRSLRLLAPMRWLKNPSHRLDIGLWASGTCIAGLLLSVAAVSSSELRIATGHSLETLLGARSPSTLGALEAGALATVVLFLAYELSYWLDHYLSHVVPVLWEFHKVHHSAEALSPLTNFRIHPIEGIKFANVSAVVIGGTAGVLDFALGRHVTEFSVLDLNVILLVLVFLVSQLQHSEVWVPLTGLAGRLILSPAHHQIHHSSDPLHYNKNLGSTLAIFDWMFGTLHVPAAKRERIHFGVAPRTPAPHSLKEGLIDPFINAGAIIARGVSGGTVAVPSEPAPPARQ